MRTYPTGDIRSVRNWVAFLGILILGVGIALTPACTQSPPPAPEASEPEAPTLSAVHDKEYWHGKGIDWTHHYKLVCIHGMPYFRWHADLRLIPISRERNFQARAWDECARIEKEKKDASNDS